MEYKRKNKAMNVVVVLLSLFCGLLTMPFPPFPYLSFMLCGIYLNIVWEDIKEDNG